MVYKFLNYISAKHLQVMYAKVSVALCILLIASTERSSRKSKLIKTMIDDRLYLLPVFS